MDHIVFIGVENEDMLPNVIRNLETTKYQYFNGDKIKSFSVLINSCIKLCKTDKFIFCSHKVSPTDNDIERLVKLLDEGYGYVGLHQFACFGVHMDIINKIGGLDENFIPAYYEDDDFRMRLQLNDIAIFEDHSVEYHAGQSTWQSKGRWQDTEAYFNSKYQFDPTTLKVKTTIELCQTIDRSKYYPFNKSVHVQSPCVYSYNEYWRYTKA